MDNIWYIIVKYTKLLEFFIIMELFNHIIQNDVAGQCAETIIIWLCSCSPHGRNGNFEPQILGLVPSVVEPPPQGMTVDQA